MDNCDMLYSTSKLKRTAGEDNGPIIFKTVPTD